MRIIEIPDDGIVRIPIKTLDGDTIAERTIDLSFLPTIDVYLKVCPFCEREHWQRGHVNIICPCGGKYYFREKFWLNRGTGERRKDATD